MVDMNIEQARHNMIEQQIRTWDVLDQRVLDLIIRTPREDFVPPQYRSLAFNDMEIPLGHDQVMMSPKLEARMLQALHVQADDAILEVGTGSGYVTALLAQLGRHVYSVEIVPELRAGAAEKLARQGINNATVEEGDAAHGWDKHVPYDVIVLTGSVPVLDDTFKKSLNIGGRLFAIIGDAPAMEAVLITRLGDDQWHTESLFETVVPPLINAPEPKRFVL